MRDRRSGFKIISNLASLMGALTEFQTHNLLIVSPNLITTGPVANASTIVNNESRVVLTRKLLT